MWLFKCPTTPTNQQLAAHLAEAEPVMEEIRKPLIARGVTMLVNIVALSTFLGEAVAHAMANSAMKGYRRVAHRFVDTAFLTAHSLLEERRGDARRH